MTLSNAASIFWMPWASSWSINAVRRPVTPPSELSHPTQTCLSYRWVCFSRWLCFFKEADHFFDLHLVGLARGSTHPAQTYPFYRWLCFFKLLGSDKISPDSTHSRPTSPFYRWVCYFKSLWITLSLALLFLTLSGCGSTDIPLIIATNWPKADRDRVEALLRDSGDRGSVVWVILAPGEKLESAVDRRGGVDLILGGSFLTSARLVASGRMVIPGPYPPHDLRPVHRPSVTDQGIAARSMQIGDPRDDPDSLGLARAILQSEGWAVGYERLVRGAADPGSRIMGTVSPVRSEGVALVEGGPSPVRARSLIRTLSIRDWSPPLTGNEFDRAAADEFLADLLGAALVDSREELREAVAALDRFGHPSKAEAALGERPPWPPASVARLLSDASGGPMVETLLEQIAPDSDSRAWLVESWSKPKRPIDGNLIADLARAVDGRLAREPRFRAWLRGEWTAWTRQLYRRVARVAGGYVPS